MNARSQEFQEGGILELVESCREGGIRGARERKQGEGASARREGLVGSRDRVEGGREGGRVKMSLLGGGEQKLVSGKLYY